MRSHLSMPAVVLVMVAGVPVARGDVQLDLAEPFEERISADTVAFQNLLEAGDTQPDIDGSGQVHFFNMSPSLRLPDAPRGGAPPNATYAIWGGFTDYLSLPDWWTYYYGIQDQDYDLLAESNEEFTTITATGAYDFYVFASVMTTQVDAFIASNGDNVFSVRATGNVEQWEETFGAPDGVYAHVGRGPRSSGYSGFIVIENPGTWSGVSVEIGSVAEWAFNFQWETKHLGVSFPDIYETTVRVESNPFLGREVTGMSFISPVGDHYDLLPYSDHEWEYDRDFDLESREAYDALFPEGEYIFEITGPSGTETKSIVFGDAQAPLAWPPRPVPLQPEFGATDVAVDPLLVWEPITDPSVDGVSNYAESLGPDGWHEAFSLRSPPSSTSVQVQGLEAGTWYDWRILLYKRQTGFAPDGDFVSYVKHAKAYVPFQTFGGIPGEPDLFIEFTGYTSGVYAPGDTFTVDARSGNQGDGLAVGMDGSGNRQLVLLEVHLSTDMIWGNADDVVVLSDKEPYVVPGDIFEGQGVLDLPFDVPPGSYHLGAFWDAPQVVDESDESNNLWWSPAPDFTVQPDCPADTNGDGTVGVTDFLEMLAAWGPNPGHPADIDGDGLVGITDFLLLLGEWGPCE